MISVCLSPVVAVSSNVKTTIDYSYGVTWKNSAGDIKTSKSLNQKYEVGYASSLGSVYDFDAKLRLGYDVSKSAGDTTKRKLNPTLDLKVQGENVGVAATLGTLRDYTDSSIDTAAVTSISNNFLLEIAGKPFMLPEFKVKLERKREYQKQTVNRYGSRVNLDLGYRWQDVGAKFSFGKELNDNQVPDNFVSRSTSWNLGLDYGRKVSDLLDLQMEYSVKESLDKGRDGGVSVSPDKAAVQRFKTGAKGGMVVLRDVSLALTYDFSAEQDLLETDYKYKAGNKITYSVKKSFQQWLVIDMKYEGSDDRVHAIEGEEDTDKVKNKLSASIKWKPSEWFDLETRAEKDFSDEILTGKAGSVEKTENSRFETNLGLVLGRDIRVQASQSYEKEHFEGLLRKESTKYKFRMPWQTTRWTKLEPSFENGLANDYDIDHDVSVLKKQSRNWATGISLNFSAPVTEYAAISADHSFDYRFKQDLSDMGEIEEQDDLSETSRLGLRIQNIIEGMKLEAELSRKASDTKDDEEPMLVDRSLNVKWEWVISDYAMGVSYRFDDKGDADDSLSFQATLGWKRDFIEVSGQYSYDKEFSEDINEARKFDVKCKLTF